MKQSYYIKEFASMLNISNQTLRFYDKIGLLKPADKNQQNNYRMYALNQIWALERIRHLQTLGLNLAEIHSALATENMADLLKMLTQKHASVVEEIERLETIRMSIDGYLNCYRYIEENDFGSHPFVMPWETRYALTERYEPDEPLIASAGPRLLIKKAGDMFSRVYFLRQIGFLLDDDCLQKGVFRPTHYFIFLNAKQTEKRPDILEHPDIIEIPAGNYLCVREYILANNGRIDSADLLCQGKNKKRFALAMECESNLDTSNEAFLESLFEIQILMERPNSVTEPV